MLSYDGCCYLCCFFVGLSFCCFVVALRSCAVSFVGSFVLLVLAFAFLLFVRCVMSVVCLFAVSMFLVSCLLLGVRWWLFVVCCSLCVVCCLLCVSCCVRFYGSLSVVCCVLFLISCVVRLAPRLMFAVC